MVNLLPDLAIAVRRLRRHPVFFIGACALLVLAVASNTAMFTLVNAIVLRPLPLRGEDRIVTLHVVREGTLRGALTLPMFVDLGTTVPALEGVAAWFQWSANLTDGGDAERLQAMRATANYLQVLGADVALGRTLTSADGTPAAAPAVVISHGLWKRRFGGSADALGRTIRLNGEGFTIVGVLGPDFAFQLRDAELIVPWSPERDPRRSNPALSFLRVVGRLAPRATAPQAQRELDARIHAFRTKFPDAAAGDRAGRVVGLREDLVGSSARTLRMLAGAVGLILLIAAANLTNLLLVNGTGRLQEFATRRALGASPRRLVAQLMTEALVLAVIGTVLGLAVARLAVSALLLASATPIPRAPEVALDRGAVLFAVTVAILISLGAALLPGLRLTVAASHGPIAQRSVTLRGRNVRAWFVAMEVALSVLLVIWAGLLVRSFAVLQRVEAGFQPSNVLSLRLSLPRARYQVTRDLTRFVEQLAPRMRAIPGVVSVAAANVVPMNGYLASATIQPRGFESRPSADWPDAHYRMISPDYFITMRIPLLRGRSFTDADTAHSVPVAIVSEGLARRYWSHDNPVGERIRIRDDAVKFREVQIVGVVGDVRHLGLEIESPSELYVPIPQVPDATSVWLANNMYWVARTHGAPLSYATTLRREVTAVDADVAASFIRSMDQWLAQSTDARQFNLRVISVFAVIALLLAAVGIYTVAAESVAIRTREMGVRAALGATHAQLLRTTMAGGLTPVIAGGVAGVAAAFGLMGALRSFFYGIAPHDPATYAAVLTLVASIGAVAVYIPARRVTRIDPVVALRVE